MAANLFVKPNSIASRYHGPNKHYKVIAFTAMEPMAQRLAEGFEGRFTFFKTKWGKFADGTDDIEIGGFYPENEIRGEHVLFLASFHNNDSTISQFHVLNALAEAFVESLTIVLPYYPTGTMERVTKEGVVATASTLARLFSNLPRVGNPIRVAVYDLHTLQNRFYLSGSALASLHSGIPVLVEELRKSKINAYAFPDEGSSKRFGQAIKDQFPEWPAIVCGKVRDGDKRIVSIQDGDPAGLDIIIIDDLVQTGGTLIECALALKAKGAKSVSAYVTHAVFPKGFDRFLRANGGPFDTFYVTNSNPTVTDKLPKDDVFKVLDLLPQIVKDL